jgi:hypothetical protein
MSARRRPDAVETWLLDGDPAIRWQVLQDLLGAPPQSVARARRRVAREGWGRRLLDVQQADGRWGEGLYSPKWTSTTYTLLLLHWLGLDPSDPQARRSCALLWDEAREVDGGLTFMRSAREAETCITGMLVLLAASFGAPQPRVDSVVEWLADQQLADGGWNCETLRSGSRHGSFHTSITALDALLEYERSGGEVPVQDALELGREFFLDHHLDRSHRTGELVDPAFERFPFPPQWHFDILRGLEHFRAAGAARDPRLRDAVESVRARRRADGTWLRHRPYPGREWFTMEPAGASRWSTLRARRVLAWWDAGA